MITYLFTYLITIALHWVNTVNTNKPIIKNKKKTLNGGLFLNGYMFYVTIHFKVSYLDSKGMQ